MSYVKILFSAFLLLGAIACNPHPHNKTDAHTNNVRKQSKQATVYTCPMHHQIRADKPGTCPICGMTLVPFATDETDTSRMTNMHPDDTTLLISLQPREQLLAGIRTDTARRIPMGSQTVLTGTTVFDPRQQDVISARTSGWIEKMYVRNPGEKLSPGQRLYELYSPDLLSNEKDYRLALEQKDLFKQASVDFTQTLEAMKQKLLRWGLTASQVKRISRDKATGKITVYSNVSGYLIQKMKQEGDHINEGDAILTLADNKTLWVRAQLYDTELPLLEENSDISIALDAYSTQRLSGKLVFNSPVNQSDSRVHMLDIAVSNPDGKLLPGMLVYVFLKTRVRTSVVAVPKTSVIYGEKNNYVWIALPHNHFLRRVVQLGTDDNHLVQILHGIEPGDQVVTSGAYLVNSEYILQYGSGVDMAGMTMSDMNMKGKSR